MIKVIEGVLETMSDGVAVVRPPSWPMSFEVMVPAYLGERLAPRAGEFITLTTFLYLEGQGQGTSFVPRLLGFESVVDRDFFELFTTVKGIGNRKALRAMAVPPAEIAALIAARDNKGLTRLPEIGKRMAETVLAELTGKVERYLVAGESATVSARGPGIQEARLSRAGEEAVEVLIQLGESRGEAVNLVERALSKQQALGGSAGSADEIVALVFSHRAI
jgi:Holliday junction DNA helicase RuvA